MTDAPLKLTLEITQPQHNAVMIGSAPVTFAGRINGTTLGPIYYKWYLPDGVDTYTSAQISVTLGVGTHVVTFTAKDVPTDSFEDLKKAKLVLMTGGGPDLDAPCIIHVLNAQLIWSTAAPYKMSKANARLQAQAAGKWGKKNNGGYDVDAAYQAINRLRYRWRLTPQGDPPNRKVMDFQELALQFAVVDDANDKKDGQPVKKAVVYYQGALPVDMGNYMLTLRVEDKQDASKFHEASQAVEIVA
jgi:hypothetical protein